MHNILITEIHISENRQRQEFDPLAITELANSILAHGLLQPIVVRSPVGDEPGKVVLVAGERRLRALQELYDLGQEIRCATFAVQPDHAPCSFIGELDELAAEEAELDENLKRRNLTWQEEAQALERLHNLRSKQAIAAGQTQTLKATSAEAFPMLTPESAAVEATKTMTLARNLADPDVAGAKTKDQALKIVQRKADRVQHEMLAAAVGRNFNSSAHALHHTDCLTWLSQCPSGGFDVILTDPPYGMEAQSFGDAAGRLEGTDHRYDDSEDSWRVLLSAVVVELFRVAKDEAHAYIFCDIDRFHELRGMMRRAGWYVFRTPLINYKPSSGRLPLPEHGPRRQYELILYAIKGKKKVTGIYSDVIASKLEENLGHGANKPIELYVDLLKRSVRPGDTVLDCFAGTGTIFPAAHQLRVRATGVEQSAEYYGIALGRLNKIDEQPDML